MSQDPPPRQRLLASTLRRSPNSEGGLRAVLANSGWLLLDKLFRIGISILVGAWVARHLGPARYGELAYVLALLALFQAACTLGLDGPVVRDVSRDAKGSGVILGSALWLRVGAGFIAWLLAVITVIAMRPGDWAALTMVAIAGASLVLQPAEIVDLWLQSQSQSRLSVPSRLAAYCVVALFKVYMILTDAPLWAFAAAALLDAMLIAVALALVYARRPNPTPWNWDRCTARRLLVESWPFMLSAISVGIYMRIDQVMLRELAGERQLGLYSAIMPFSQGWYVIPMTLYASILPRLSQLHQQAPHRYQARLQQAFTMMAWGGVAAAGLTVAFAPWLITVLLGPRFEEAVPILQWHAVTNVFVFMGVAQSLAIVSERTPRLALIKTLIGVVVNVLANMFFIPRWGAIGSAWAAAICQCCSVVLSNIFLAPRAFRMQIRAFFPFRQVSL